ncbi:hypothetical protein ACPOL_0545 [Acidisarcina polymorpha]|uniref:Uncharacterized protein n=1 Tax=Acidisarcina polymorpha TaxID=2211140 RepID=A0A2Z5FSY0_9BACT|nr:hypothetical protein ACPOL_0545 [Acidisarcina polymorpha]
MLSPGSYIPPNRHEGHSTPLKRPRHIQLVGEIYEVVERKVGPNNAGA